MLLRLRCRGPRASTLKNGRNFHSPVEDALVAVLQRPPEVVEGDRLAAAGSAEQFVGRPALTLRRLPTQCGKKQVLGFTFKWHLTGRKLFDEPRRIAAGRPLS